jgi:hypothetical protein
MKPASLFKGSFEIRITSSDDKDLINLLKSVFLFPFAVISAMRERS